MYKKAIVILFILFNTNVYCQNQVLTSDLLKKLETAKDSDKANIYTQISGLYIYQQKPDSALIYTNLCLSLCERIGDEKGLANAYVFLGNVSHNSSDNKKAMDFYVKALRIYEKNNLYKNASKTLNNISVIFTDELKYDQALENIFQAVTYSLKIKDTLSLLSFYSTISYDYAQMKNLEKSKYYFNKANELLNYKLAKLNSATTDSLDIIFWRIQISYLRAILNSEEGHFLEAINIHKKILKEEVDFIGNDQKIESLKGIAENYYRLKEYLLALEYSNKALTQLKTDSIPYSYMDIYSLRSKIFAGMERYDEAYKTHMLYKDISDTILNKQNFESISNLKINYETEKKEEEIYLLNKKRKTQQIVTGLTIGAFVITLGFLFFVYRSRKLQQKLFKQRAEKHENERLLERTLLEKKMNELEQMGLNAQMNPHFIFNSLNSVQHFIMNKDVEGVNKYLGAFAHLIRQTLNNSSKQVISLDEEIKYLETYLSLEKMKSNNGFNYSFIIDESINSYSIFIPSMILQPFVENCIKHGMANNEKKDGQINITMSKNGMLLCKIDDNGIGRKKAAEVKLKNKKLDYESKGMEITMNRIVIINKLYNSNISVFIEDLNDLNGEPNGTSVQIKFPTDMG
jgi:tetratricopeptide (TPR) repeat protein